MSNPSFATLILCAGKGTRFKSHTPKVLHELMGKPMLNHILDQLPFDEKTPAICVVSPENNPHISHAVSGLKHVHLCLQTEQKGTAHAVLSAMPALTKTKASHVLVLPGDMPLLTRASLKKLLKLHLQKKSPVTVLTGSVTDPKGYGRIKRDSNGIVERITEEKDCLPEEKLIREINTGVYCFEMAFLKDNLKKIKSGNAQKEFYLTDTLSIAYSMSLKSEVPPPHALHLGDSNECYGVNSRQELSFATVILKERINAYWMSEGVTLTDPATTYIDDTVTIGRDTVIHPFTVLQGNIKIGDACVIGPFCHLHHAVHIEDGAVIGNFVEIKKSTVGKHSKVKHLTYLGNATLGKKVNVGAGTITANYDGKHKHPTHIGDETRIGSNTVIVAPNKLGKRLVIGAGSVIPANRNFKSDCLVFGVPAVEKR